MFPLCELQLTTRIKQSCLTKINYIYKGMLLISTSQSFFYRNKGVNILHSASSQHNFTFYFQPGSIITKMVKKKVCEHARVTF